MKVKRFGMGERFFFGLHGWSGDWRTFQPLVKDLPADVSLFSVDLPGCGASAQPREWTADAIAEEIAEEIINLGRPVTVVGSCSGAIFGLQTALLIQNRIERVVMIDAFAFWPSYFKIFLHPVIGRRVYFTTFANPLGRWFTNLSLRSKRKRSTNLTDGFDAVDHETTYRYLHVLDGIDPLRFGQLSIPIDVLYGEKSFAAVQRSAKVFEDLCPAARSTRLAGAGHLPLLEATEQIRQILFSPRPEELLCTIPTSKYVSL